MSLSENLRRLRKAGRLNQAQLAKKIGISINTIGRMERGEWSGPLDRILNLADFFGVKPWELDENLERFQPAEISVPDLSDFTASGTFQLIQDEPKKKTIARFSNHLDRLISVHRNHIKLDAGSAHGQRNEVNDISLKRTKIFERLCEIEDADLLNEIVEFIDFKLSKAVKHGAD